MVVLKVLIFEDKSSTSKIISTC